MKNIASILSLCALSVLCMPLIGGCKSESGPAGPQIPAYPSVAPNWKGIGIQKLTEGRILTFDLTASIQQAQDSLWGYWYWTIQRTTSTYKEYFVGKVTTTREIGWYGTSFQPATAPWALCNYKANLSAHGDTISGSWTDAGGGSGTGLLVVVR